MLASNVKLNRDIIRDMLFDPETRYPRGQFEEDILNQTDAAVEEIRNLAPTRLGKFDLPKLIAKHAMLLAYYRATAPENVWLQFVGEWTLVAGMSVRVKNECLKLIEAEFENILSGAKLDVADRSVTIIVESFSVVSYGKNKVAITYVPSEDVSYE